MEALYPEWMMGILLRGASEGSLPQADGLELRCCRPDADLSCVSPLNKVLLPGLGAYTWKGRSKGTQKLAQSCRPEKNHTELKGGKQRLCFPLLILAVALCPHLLVDI